VDTPGCNEYDNGVIYSNISHAQKFGSAFILVTSFEAYREEKVSSFLMDTVAKHPG